MSIVAGLEVVHSNVKRSCSELMINCFPNLFLASVIIDSLHQSKELCQKMKWRGWWCDWSLAKIMHGLPIYLCSDEYSLVTLHPPSAFLTDIFSSINSATNMIKYVFFFKTAMRPMALGQRFYTQKRVKHNHKKSYVKVPQRFTQSHKNAFEGMCL